MSNIPRDGFMACPTCGRKTIATVNDVSGLKTCTGCKTDYLYSRTMRVVYETEAFK